MGAKFQGRPAIRSFVRATTSGMSTMIWLPVNAEWSIVNKNDNVSKHAHDKTSYLFAVPSPD